MKAMTLPASSAEPPPKAITPSCPPARSISSPSATLASVGLDWTSEKTAASRPASLTDFSARWAMGSGTTPGSVTKSGRAIPAARAAAPSSAMRPAPKRMAVG